MISISTPFLFGLLDWTTYFYGLMCLLLLEIILRITIIFDAIIVARASKDYQLGMVNQWYSYLIYMIIGWSILFSIEMSQLTGIQTFIVPSSSNEPTVDVGEWVVGDLEYQTQDIDYGHLVFYERPNDEIWIHRVIGLPGDSLRMVDNQLFINGNPCPTRDMDSMQININDLYEHSAIQFEETLPNGHKHLSMRYQIPLKSRKSNFDTLVPDAHYYLLGDNRDNSMDSRYIGPIPEANIKGRILYSYWAKDWNQINIDYRVR